MFEISHKVKKVFVLKLLQALHIRNFWINNNNLVGQNFKTGMLSIKLV